MEFMLEGNPIDTQMVDNPIDTQMVGVQKLRCYKRCIDRGMSKNAFYLKNTI